MKYLHNRQVERRPYVGTTFRFFEARRVPGLELPASHVCHISEGVYFSYTLPCMPIEPHDRATSRKQEKSQGEPGALIVFTFSVSLMEIMFA